jgi:hypothetical protein
VLPPDPLLSLVSGSECQASNNLGECQKWLKAEPLTELGDVHYLLQMEKELYESLLPNNNEAPAKSAKGTAKRGANWTPINWLCFIHCIMDDRAHVAMMQKHTSKSRSELDASHTTGIALPSFKEKLCELYNDDESNHYRLIPMDPEQCWKLAEEMNLSFSETTGKELTFEKAKEHYVGL